MKKGVRPRRDSETAPIGLRSYRPPGWGKAWLLCLLWMGGGCSEFRPTAPGGSPMPAGLAPPLPADPETQPPAEDSEVPEVSLDSEGVPPFFGLPCTDHADCSDSNDPTPGYCHSMYPGAESSCTIGCVASCPEGYGCNAVGNAGDSDLLFLCTMEPDVSCASCQSSQDCLFDNARCVDIDAAGGSPDLRCAFTCTEHSDCGQGYECLVLDGAGMDLDSGVCVPVSGSCTCTGQETYEVVPAPCSKLNEHGQCHGMQVCASEVGWLCDARTPTPEICDALDNNCNGEVDEGCPPTQLLLELSAAVLPPVTADATPVHLSVAPLGLVGRSDSPSGGTHVRWGFYPALDVHFGP